MHKLGVIKKEEMKMKEFDFNGKWEFDLELNALSDCFKFEWIEKPERRREKIRIRIIDAKNENSIPEIEQINSINFILNNSELIIDSVYECLSDIIIPKFEKIVENDVFFLTGLSTKKDLSKFLGIGEISIFYLAKGDYAYTNFYFNSFRYDLEHGINLIFHKTRFIGFHEDFKEAYEDIGIKYEDVLKELSLSHQSKIENREFLFYKSDVKPLKPWQISENRFYLSRLLHTNQPDKFIAFMQKNKDEVEFDMETLKNLSVRYGFDDVLEYLEKIK